MMNLSQEFGQTGFTVGFFGRIFRQSQFLIREKAVVPGYPAVHDNLLLLSGILTECVDFFIILFINIL